MEYMLSAERKQAFVVEFRRCLEKSVDLPALPEVAQELLALGDNPDANISDLTAIISRDPGVSLQILQFARLSGFGYGERIKTIEDAVQLVLGFNKALHMAMGLSAGRSLKMPNGGPLGRKRFWEHSLHSAMLAQLLAKELPADKGADPGISYLAGLVHDIGFLLLGHLYPTEFATLSRLIEKCSDRELRELEFQCLGISHDMIGLFLMKAWKMPEEIIAAVGEHHFPDYGGKHAIYAKLVYLANQLLIQQGRGYGEQNNYVLSAMPELGLEETQIERALTGLHELSPEMARLAEDMAA